VGAGECAIKISQAISLKRNPSPLQLEKPPICANEGHGVGDRHQAIAPLALRELLAKKW
jgi:hypothetical protein